MKRCVAALVSLALILAASPPSAWAQLAQAARAPAAAVRLGPAVSVPVLSAASIPSFQPGFRPIELAAPLALAPAAAARAAAVPAAVPADAAPALGARAALTETGRALSAPGAPPAPALDRLFTGAASRSAFAGDAAAVASAALAASLPALAPASARADGRGPDVPGPARAPSRPPSRILGAAKSAGRAALAAAVVIGLDAAAAAAAPALFAVVPAAAAWAVASGVFLFPAALYARRRLARRDSPRLDKVKILLDLALGAYAGALAVAAPSLALAFSSAGVLTAAVPAAGLAAGLGARGAPFLNSIMVWGALGIAPLALGASAAGGLAVAPLLGMLALPVMTTVAFFLGGLISSAETGRAFAAPGAIGKTRFPSFPWIMTGVVFALLSGYAAAYGGAAFLVWTLLGLRSPSKRDGARPLWKNVLNKAASFDALYLGLLVFVAAGGFSSPLVFVAIAFSGERAAAWTERLLARLLPKGPAAPSTAAAAARDGASGSPAPRSRAFYWAKTAAILAAAAGVGVMAGLTVFGFHGLLLSALPAAALAAVPYWFAAKIVKLVMRGVPSDEKADPEFFAIMRGLRERINAKRRALGKREIPMPEMVDDPLLLPNAYATGRSPFRALVGVTEGIKRMTLDPENVRDGVARLIANAGPGSKSFRVFRFAVAGSISGVTEASPAADVQAAILKADRVELKALGVRMLTGVLSHEFSHVMDRHMLSGAIAGAISSSIAFASYGVVWAIGRAQAGAVQVFDRLLGRRAPEASPEARAGSDEAAQAGSRTLLVDPISAGAAIKSLPALLKLFAALWVPVLSQIVSTASSRANEDMADEDGALLSQDPQALALALGLLTTWRPRTGFMLAGVVLPRVAALSFMMTVNPLQQAAAAGALPKLEPAARAVAGKGDDFLFDLFATHPDTAARIERLSDMADALRSAKPPRPAAAPEETAAPARAEGGLLRRGWERLKGVYRVLPDESRNRAFWAYTLGQSLATLGMDFHYTALPNLVAPTKADTAKLGYNRAMNWGAQAAGSLLTGPFVDRQPVKRTLVWTYVGRALLMAAVPVLFATGYFGFAAFCLLIAAAGFLQATGGTAGSVAFNRILGGDEAYYNRANAVMTIVTNVVGVVGPLLAGAFIAWAGTFFAVPLTGSALSYGVYAVLLLATGAGYGLLLKLPRDEMLQARRGLLASLKGADSAGARVKGVTAGRSPDGRAALLVEIKGVEPSRAKGLPPEFAGYPVLAAAPRSPFRELVEGFKLTWSSRFLRLYLMLSTLSIASGDSLVFAALPRYLADVLKSGPGAFGLLLAASALGLGAASAAMTLVKDPAQAALAPVAVEFRAALAARDRELDADRLDRAAAALRGSLNEVLERYKTEWREGRGRPRLPDELAADVLSEAAPVVGRVLESSPEESAALLEASGAARDVRLWAARRGAGYVESARRDAKSGMDSLQRQGRWTNLLHAASWAAYAGVFFAHALWPSVGLMFVSALLAGPASIVWASLTTRVVAGSFPNDQGKVYSAMTFYMLAASVVGVLGLSWMMAALPTATGLLIAAGILLACTAFDAIQSFAVFPLNRR